jgi:hypothetical protein
VVVVVVVVVVVTQNQGTTKTATLGTAYILWNLLMQKYKTFDMEYKITCTINCNYRMAATLYTLETLFGSGI